MKKIKNREQFIELCDWCIEKEPKLEAVIQQFDYPPFWHREANFETLILTILEQQVSLASAKAAYNKLEEKLGNISPENLLKLNDEELRACSFSRQKIIYSRILATEIVEGRIQLEILNNLSEEEIRKILIRLKGIGNWTIDMYVLMSLHFADIFPPGDLATIKSVYELELVPIESSKDEIIKSMKRFSPHQSVVTYILWHYYIEKRNLKLE